MAGEQFGEERFTKIREALVGDGGNEINRSFFVKAFLGIAVEGTGCHAREM